ncbi:hypothetical protein [Rubritalea halochordaticola]|uniref:hypothetical protein n=1 Tax=Rubritalea halochordaticola TaxID=714537 RepID=UPI0031FD09F4
MHAHLFASMTVVRDMVHVLMTNDSKEWTHRPLPQSPRSRDEEPVNGGEPV